ncbi:MAG: hypothetical protein ABWZ27_08230 [Aestuariivirgaceae bacterium]
MTKGISNWIKAHTPIGRSKSEQSRPSESRAKTKLEQTRQTKVTFDPHARDIRLESARFAQMQPSRRARSDSTTTQTEVPTAEKRGTPPKPTEAAPLGAKARTLPRSSAPLTTRQGDHGSAEFEAKGTVKTDSVDEDHVIAELRKELDLLIPDESEDDTTEDLPTGLRTTTEPQGLSDEEILASFSLDSIMSDAGLNFDDLPSVAPETKPSPAEGDQKVTSAGQPKPRELPRKHQHQKQTVPEPVSPEQRGIVTRRRQNITTKPT